MRFQSWPEILAKQIEAARSRPFVWGEHDCALFAANVVKAMTGQDFTKEFIGKYKTAAGATKLIAKNGGLENIATQFLGESMPIYFAGRGDVVLVILEGIESLGICIGTHCAFVGLEKMEFLPLTDCEKAWPV